MSDILEKSYLVDLNHESVDNAPEDFDFNKFNQELERKFVVFCDEVKNDNDLL